MGFIIGALAGAVVMLLYAPKSGDITREELRAQTEDLRRRAEELQKIAQKLADDASVKGCELIAEDKKQWDSSSAGLASTGSRSRPELSTNQDCRVCSSNRGAW